MQSSNSVSSAEVKPNKSLQPTANMLRMLVPSALRAAAASEFKRWTATEAQ